MLLRAPEAQQAFNALTRAQQDPLSAMYHHWLRPEQIGALYGPTAHDVAAVVAWLRAAGLTAQVDPTRTAVATSGTLAQYEAALGIDFARYAVGDEELLGVTTAPAVPNALAPIVASFLGLSDEPATPQFHSSLTPAFTTKAGGHLLTPADFATIFDVAPLYASGNTGQTVEGTQQHVAIYSKLDASRSDLALFAAAVKLPATQVTTYRTGDQADASNESVLKTASETMLDVERVVGQAPGVAADLILSNSIPQAISYNNTTLRAPVLSVSYHLCGRAASDALLVQIDALAQDAAAEGISIFFSSGDSGAVCGGAGNFHVPNGTELKDTNAYCSSPYITCVGGTMLHDGDAARFWNSNNTGALESVRSYIPEGVWNEPVAKNGSYVLAGTGGGASERTRKPEWQVGPGVPADGVRDLPDIAFPAAGNDPFYIVLNGKVQGLYGTSAAAPSAAAVAALVNTAAGTRQGNWNPLLYRLANSPAAPLIFHDVTLATSGVATCDVLVALPCNNSTPSASSLTGGIAGYAAGVGYDQATGWGSLDVAHFAAAAHPVATGLTLVASAYEIDPDQTVRLTATLQGTSVVSPTGQVTFYVDGVAVGTPAPVSRGTAVSDLRGIVTTGPHQATAVYSGDTFFHDATSAAIPITVMGPGVGMQVASQLVSFASGAVGGTTNELTVMSQHEFAGAVQLSCAVTKGSGTIPPTCSLGTSTVDLSAGGTATVAVGIHSSARQGSAAAGQGGGRAAIALGGVGCLLLWVAPGRRRIRPGLLCVLLLPSIWLCGCGGGSRREAAVTSAPADAGTYVVTVTASSPAGTDAGSAATTTFSVTIF